MSRSANRFALFGPLLVVGWTAAALADEAPTAGPAAPTAAVDYATEIKPLLAARCVACHGPLRQQQGLRLDSAAAIRRGGESGPAIEPHKPRESLLIRAVTGADGWRMPPEGEPLSADEISRLARWIDAGAPAPHEESTATDPSQHWAFRPPVRPDLSEGSTTSPGRSAVNPIDAFVDATLRQQGLEPYPPASRERLLRRVYLDLIGLPPTRDELLAFLADESPDAYEQVVDRLLADPRHGERWARHFMDIWRYSDWYGYGAELRNSQPHLWRWRDWIVESLNADRGYDRMLIEMLAGDEVAPTDLNVVRATGYLARNWYKFNRNTWLQDTIEHTGKAFLGLTFNCARCHDHKYDPISQENYYQLRAYFEPHEVRVDVAGGQLDTKVDGVARVYDAYADRPTHVFARGDEKEPDNSRVLAPALPSVVAPESIAITAVPLPGAAWYPALASAHGGALLVKAQTERDAVATQLQQRRAELARLQIEIEQQAARLELLDELTEPALDSPTELDRLRLKNARSLVTAVQAALEVDEKQLAVADANLVSLTARLAADQGRYLDPPAANIEDLMRGAANAERAHAVAAAELQRHIAQREHDRLAAKPLADEATKKSLAEAAAKLADADKALEAARAALASTGVNYSSVGSTYPRESTGRRLALARWIADRRNPLTARVLVNHVWLRHFGRPLVSTVFDFGMNGKPPTHPELLDWLAVELMEQGWSIKSLHRMIVLSVAYRRDSAADSLASNLQIDPDNRYLWRANTRRMEAEVVRDSLLYLAGSLELNAGGPEIDQKTADTTSRRSLYYRHANEKRVTFLELFDQAGVGEGYQRTESVVPQQALALLNSEFAHREARLLADRLGAVAAADQRRFIGLAFETVLGRAATDAELATCLEFLTRHFGARSQDVAAAESESDGVGGASAVAAPQTATPENSAGANSPSPDVARARASLVHALFNHNDFLAIR
ncbi:MAG: DUF1553 domain-containing protein [Pirellulales bacterium]|nr:DUF1553 domain-containing protein [Pirellulales bacterium]